LAQEPDGEEAGADGEAGALLEKVSCDLDEKGHGELLRTSGTDQGASMSSGHETLRVRLGEVVLVELNHQGRLMFGAGASIEEDDEPWKVSCSRGAIRIRAGDAEVRLSVNDGSTEVDAKWLRSLAPERSKALALEVLEQLATVLDGISGRPEVAGRDEAVMRASLLLADRAIDAGETDKAENALGRVKVDRVPSIAAWYRQVADRLKSVRGSAPLRPVKPKRLGTLQHPPATLHGVFGEEEEEKDPEVGLFWRRTSLCVRQEGEHRGDMRCYDAVAGKWSGIEPYLSPYAAGPKLHAVNLGRAGGYGTQLILSRAGVSRDAGTFSDPTVLARDVSGGLVVYSAGSATGNKASVVVEGYDAAMGAGSLLAGGGKYYFDGPTSLRSLAQPGRSWSFPAPGKGAGVVCVGQPLTSPDEKRAACLASKDPAGTAKAPHELWIFEIVDAAR
jgi:hypothetical protein